jgi:hypothetical protein
MVRGADEPLLIQNANRPRDWRINREIRFILRQERKREWIPFREIAEWLSEIDGRGVPNEAARANAYDMLQRDLMGGDFEEAGRSKVLCLHPLTTKGRMRRQQLSDAIDTFPPDRLRAAYLSRCWIPRRMFDRFLAKHELPAAPRRFEPRERSAKNENETSSPGPSLTLTPPPNARRRGRKPKLLNQVKEAMQRDLREGRQTRAGLGAMREKELAATYSGGRTTVRNARNAVLSKCDE